MGARAPARRRRRYGSTDIGVKLGNQCVEVAGPRRSNKGVDDLALLANGGLRLRYRATHTSARVIRELANTVHLDKR